MQGSPESTTPTRSRAKSWLVGLLPALLLWPIAAPAQEAGAAEAPPVVEPEAAAPPSRWPEVPGRRLTRLALAGSPLGDQVYTFMVDRDGHVLFQTFDPATGQWSMSGNWVEVPGALLTDAAVAAIQVENRLHLFAIGKDDRRVYFNDKLSGGPFEGWGGWRPLAPTPGKAVAVGAAARGDSDLAVFLVTDKNKLYFTTDPLPFIGWELVPGEVTTSLAPGAVWDAPSDTLSLFVRRSNKSEVVLLTRRDGTWSAPCKVPDAGASHAVTPALSAGQLYLFSVADKKVWAQAYGGTCGLWTGRAEVPGTHQTASALGLAPMPGAGGDGFPFLLLARSASGDRAHSTFFLRDDVVSEVNTRDHFNTGNGDRRQGHTAYDYGVAGPFPGYEAGTECPEHLAIAVHGWTNRRQAGQEKFLRAKASLRQLGYSGPVVGFSWDSATEGCPFLPDALCGFEDGKDIADGNGPKLAAFLGDFKERCPCTTVHLMAHSLGARVTLKALRALAEDPSLRWSQLGNVKVDDVHLLGAAMDNETVQLDHEFGASIQTEVVKFYNYRSSSDDDLRFYVGEEGDEALGRDGIENPNRAPANFEQLNVAARNLVGSDHNAYWGKTKNGVLTGTGAMSRVFERFALRSDQCSGWFDGASCTNIAGWAWDKAHPGERATVRVYVDGNLLFEGAANESRADLVAAGIGDGRHAFAVPVPLVLKDGQVHEVAVKFNARTTGEPLATPHELPLSEGGSRTFQCSLEGVLEAVFCGDRFGVPSLTVRGWAWDPARPNTPVEVLVKVGDRNPVPVPAAMLRQDLLDADPPKGNGRHGFVYSLPLCTGGVSDPFGCIGTPGDFTVRAAIEGSNFELTLSPRSVFCPRPTVPDDPPFPGDGF